MHHHCRRGALAAGALVAALSALVWSPVAEAQEWPRARPITFVVPFPAGGGTDAFARPLAAQLEQQLGQRIVIENRGGAGGTLGASHAAKQAPDGYTFFVGATHHTIAPALYPNLDYSIETSFEPVGMISRPPQVIVASPRRVAATTLRELIADAKARPDALNFASAGVGTTHHLAGELFKAMTGTAIRHIPYRGAGPAMQDLVGGQVELMFDGLGSSAPQIASGTIRALAVAAAQRSPALPDVPTAAEAGLPGYEVSTWYALWAPKGTPAAILSAMQNELRKALATPSIRDTWERLGSDMPDIMGEAFGRFVAAEVLRWGEVVKRAEVKLQ